MSYSQWPDQHGVYGYESLNSNSIQLQTYVAGDAGSPFYDANVQEGMSNYPSPNAPVREGISNYSSPNAPVQEGIPNHPSPNLPNNIAHNPPEVHDTAEHRRSGYTFSSWLPELLCCILGIIALMADVVVLSIANGQPPTVFRITINTLIQFITSVAKFAFLVPIASAVGQLRWLWFKKKHQLRDFLLHDDAGSGGLSSVKFSLKFRMLRKSPIAWLAAVIALSGFFTSPLTQLTIGYVSDRQVLNNGTASVARASILSRRNSSGFQRIQGEDLLIQTAYLAAAYLGPNQTLPGVDPICSSGDCDWPIYGSLGICAETVNISASTNSTLLFLLHLIFVAELRGSQYSTVFAQAGSAPYYLAFLIPFNFPSTEFKEAPQQMVISQSFIGYFNSPLSLTNDTDLDKIQFIGVSLYLCTQSFSTTVKDGIQNTSELAYSTNILSSSTAEPINSYWNSALFETPICDPGPLTGSTIALSGATGLSNETYTIDFCSAVYISELYVAGTGGGILLDTQLRIIASVGQISEALGIAIYGDFNGSSIPDPLTQYKNVELMMNNIGKSLTSYMRNQGPTFPNQDNSTITGIVYAPQTVISIRWPYLSFLAIQLVLTTIVLLFTIVFTHRGQVQILKKGSLATLCALSNPLNDRLGGMEDMERLKGRARELWVDLELGANGEIIGFKLVDDKPDSTSWISRILA